MRAVLVTARRLWQASINEVLGRFLALKRKGSRLVNSQRLGVFLLTYWCYAIVYVTRKAFSVVKTLIRDDLSLDAYTLGGVDSAFLGTYALFQVYLPSLSDKFGVRPVLIAALMGAGIFSGCFSMASSPRSLCGIWLLEGLCHAPIFSVLVKAVSLWYTPTERLKVLGIWTTSQQVGGMLATVIATYVGTRFGWRNVFIAASLLTCGFGLLIAFCLPEPPEGTTIEVKNDNGGAGGGAGDDDDDDIESPSNNRGEIELSILKRRRIVIAKDKNNKPSFLQVLLLPGLLPCACAYFCVKLVRYALLFWLPFFLTTQLKFDPETAGYSSMAFDAGGVLGSVASGFIAERVFRGKRFITTAAMCIATASSLLALRTVATSSTGINTALCLMASVGFFIAGPDSVLGATAAGEVIRRKPACETMLSTATGIVNGLGAFGGLVQGYLTAYISSEFGWGALFDVLAVAAIAAVLCLSNCIIWECRNIEEITEKYSRLEGAGGNIGCGGPTTTTTSARVSARNGSCLVASGSSSLIGQAGSNLISPTGATGLINSKNNPGPSTTTS